MSEIAQDSAQAWRGRVAPGRGRWRWAAVRVGLAACALILIRFHAAAWPAGDDGHAPLPRRGATREDEFRVRSAPAQAAKELAPSSGQARATGRTVKVAAVQFISQMAGPETNRRRLEAFVREAARNGAKIVVLPETAITGYMSHDIGTTWHAEGRPLAAGMKGLSPREWAETVPGPSTRAFGALAKELGIYLTVPFLEVEPGAGKFYNTLCLAGPDGRLLLHYRKLNPWPFAERSWATAGDRGLQAVDTPYGRLGLLICYDINFEPPRLREMKVDTLLYSIAWVDAEGSAWFRVRLPRIARENDLNIIGANWSVPEKPKWHGYGQSLIIARTGEAPARVRKDIGEEIIYAELPVGEGQRP